MISSDNRSSYRVTSWRLLIVALTLLAAGVACNLTNQRVAIVTPTLNPANTVPPTRTLLPTGQIPSPLPGGVVQQPTQVVLFPTNSQPTAIILPTVAPIYTATPFPTRIPTSTPLPVANLAIYSPANNNVVAGIIQILGSATHPFFLQYQLEFSPDPGELWGLIPGSISTISVQNGLLGLWDTRQTPDGIYQLRLRVFTGDGGSSLVSVRNLRVSNQTATQPPTATPTFTATATATFTLVPTSTPIPTDTPIPPATVPAISTATSIPTLTSTLVPTDVPTITPSPTQTATESPTQTPLPSITPIAPTATQAATNTPIPTTPPLYADLNSIPVVPMVSFDANLRQVYENGILLGNRPTAFSKAGDENTSSPAFLADIGNGFYYLDVFSGMQGIIDFFGTTVRTEDGVQKSGFNVNSLAAAPGWTTYDLLDPGQSDPSICLSGESPLVCEIRLSQPSIFLVMIGTHDLVTYANSPESFRANLQVIVSTAFNYGVIPVLSTIPERLDGMVTSEQVLAFNTEIVNVAQASGIPLWNFWLAVRDLPGQGLGQDGLSLGLPPAGTSTADFSAFGLNYGYNQRNFTALQVLNAVRGAIFPDAPPPTPTAVAVIPSETPLPAPTSTEFPTITPTSTEIPSLTPIPSETLAPTELPTLTPVPTDQPSVTPLPTLTPIPTEPPTLTPIPTETPVPTEPPTVTPLPTETPVPTEPPTLTPIPTEIPAGVDLNLIPVLPDFASNPAVAEAVQIVFNHGQAMGMRSNVFALAGDKLATDAAFLDDLGTGLVQWDVYATELEPVLLKFMELSGEINSFTRLSVSANPGWTASMMLEPAQADPGFCQPGETPLQCELRLTQPAFVFVGAGRNDVDPAFFRQSLEVVVQTATNAGVVPILVTLPGDEFALAPYNAALVETAAIWNMPVWNLWLALRDLPERGINPDGTLRVSVPGQSAIFTSEQLQYGANQSNLSFMQLLEALSELLALP